MWHSFVQSDRPTPLPFIGNVLSFTKKDRWEDVFLKWRERYGPVMTIWMGMKPMVLINDYATAHRMFVKEGETFVDRRMDAHFAKIARGGLFGIIIASGERWRQQRRFALHTLRDFGLNKSQLEARVLDEVQYVIDHLNEDVRAGVEEVDVYNYTDIAVGSVVNSIICGYRFTGDNKQEEFYKLKKLTTDILANFSNPLFGVILPSPFLHRFSWVQRKMHEAVKPQKEVFRFLDGIIQQHEEQND
ncbi:(pine wood nematode) hypothetical protein [Aphelenchoides fujianensis]|nr:(pine wood nematode) hypothetical protein [Aphelenchoides fujianensis]